MKKLIMNYRLIILAGALISAGIVAKAQIYSDNLKLSKAFKVNSSSTVEVYNKYGKLHIITWAEDSVRFEVNASIQSSSESKVKKTRDNLAFDFTGTEYYITAKTVFGSSYSGFFKDLADFAESFISNDNKVEINYTIFIPEYVNLKLNNKFGDIYIEDIVGDINITLSNGDLKANNFKGNANIQILMGDGDIKSMKNGKLYISYCDLTLEEAEQLNIDSKFSKINIEKANIIKISSKKDKLFVTSIQQLFGESYFSDIWLYNLDTKVNFRTRYGNINLETISKEFKFIDLVSEYTDVNLFFQSGSSYNVDITHKNSYLKYPEEIAELKNESMNEDGTEINTFGKIGKGTTDSKVKISAIRGNINIFHK